MRTTVENEKNQSACPSLPAARGAAGMTAEQRLEGLPHIVSLSSSEQHLRLRLHSNLATVKMACPAPMMDVAGSFHSIPKREKGSLHSAADRPRHQRTKQEKADLITHKSWARTRRSSTP